jgi:hypothetical protein
MCFLVAGLAMLIALLTGAVIAPQPFVSVSLGDREAQSWRRDLPDAADPPPRFGRPSAFDVAVVHSVTDLPEKSQGLPQDLRSAA